MVSAKVQDGLGEGTVVGPEHRLGGRLHWEMQVHEKKPGCWSKLSFSQASASALARDEVGSFLFPGGSR